jgi:ribosomal protein S8
MLKSAIAKVLADEGYIAGFTVEARGRRSRSLSVQLKYSRRPSGHRAPRTRVPPGPAAPIARSRTPCRRFCGGLGIAIVSTPQGVMTDQPGPRRLVTAAKSSASSANSSRETDHVRVAEKSPSTCRKA